ncbi:hypothetical protein BDV93DRAFT_558535 [Ceratobasidium sp. AG-I]|nr:hypothetical protein BDV93DRAFT_558535 [Ceratobasidium sp. AG-I]
MSGASFGRIRHQAVPLRFPQIMDSWYRDKELLKIKKIEHRKELDRPFLHEFVYVVLSDGTVHRFDRRPDPSALGTLWQQGSAAFDTVQQVDNPDDLNHSSEHPPSECLAVLDFNEPIDLSIILAICFAIQTDERASRYTMQQYNCYFFSWAIISSTARYLVAWEDIPNSTNFLHILSEAESETFTAAMVAKLAEMLPQNLSNALIFTVPYMLADMFPNRLLELSDQEESINNGLHTIIEHSFTRPLLEAKLHTIIHLQLKAIRLVLNNSSLLNKLRNEVQLALGDRHDDLGYEARKALGDFFKSILWYCDIDLKTFDSSALLSFEGWDTPTDPGYLLGNERLWSTCADFIASEVSQLVAESTLATISNQVYLALVEILPGKFDPNIIRYRNSIDEKMPIIEEIIVAAIMIATRERVRRDLIQIRKNGDVSREAAKSSMAETIKKTFPDTLPTALRIPDLRSNSVRPTSKNNDPTDFYVQDPKVSLALSTGKRALLVEVEVQTTAL